MRFAARRNGTLTALGQGKDLAFVTGARVSQVGDEKETSEHSNVKPRRSLCMWFEKRKNCAAGQFEVRVAEASGWTALEGQACPESSATTAPDSESGRLPRLAIRSASSTGLGVWCAGNLAAIRGRHPRRWASWFQASSIMHRVLGGFWSALALFILRMRAVKARSLASPEAQRRRLVNRPARGWMYSCCLWGCPHRVATAELHARPLGSLSELSDSESNRWFVTESIGGVVYRHHSKYVLALKSSIGRILSTD